MALGPTTVFVRYQSAADKGGANAQYGITSVTSNRDALGRVEDFMDLSSAGVQTAGQAQAPASAVLAKYQRVAFTDAVTFAYGALRTLGGAAIDPGCFYTEGSVGMVCKLLLADYTPPADVIVGAPSVLVGSYQWDDATMTGTLQPAESVRHNFSSLMQMIADSRPARSKQTHRHHHHKALHH